MKAIAYIFVMAMAMLLQACGHDQDIIYRDRNVLIVPDDELIKPCDIPKPPTKQEYLAGDADKREDLLTKHVIDQNTALRTCNGRFTTLRAWKKQKQDLYNKPKEP